MKTLVALALLTSACVGSGAPKALQTQSDSPADADAIKQVSQDMGNAMIAGDVQKLNQIFADDWATIGSSGEVTTKAALLTDFASFHDKLEWFECGPIDVQVFGNTGLAQGNVKEKRSKDGKDTSGEFVWMDLLEKRAGKWIVVRSAGARVAPADSPAAPSQDPTANETIKNFEQEVGDAMVAVDIDKLSRAFADDWAAIGSAGQPITKDGLLTGFKSRELQLRSFKLGSMNVQIHGDVAAVQTSVVETKIRDGKDVSGNYVFMDLLKKRAGTWVILRTIGAKVT